VVVAGRVKRTRRGYSLFYPTLIGLGLGVIASCARQQPHPPAPPPPPQAAPPRRVARTRPTLLPQEKPLPPAASGETGAPYGLSDLLGLDEPATAQLLGAADKKIERPPAVVWQYEAPDCMLDLYFYLDLKSGRMRTLRYAVEGSESESECLTTILNRNGTTQKDAAPPPS
jgi:hypothetical protein